MPDYTVKVYAQGMVSLLCCAPADMPTDQVEASVNQQVPAGGDLRWSMADDPTFKSGEPNPCVCHDDAGRLHYLLHC